MGRNLPKALMRKLMTPLEHFLAMESAAGFLLLAVTILAMTWANSPWLATYEALIQTPISFQVGHFSMGYSLHHWVNDALMVIFFFVVGLEIKRELILGELSSPRKASLPLFAALGGMVVPASIYASLNWGQEGIAGWGIPMATDIAFAIGVVSLMSRKVPFALKVFLLALAIVDDLGAVAVIAFFYTEDIVRESLIFATAALLFTAFVRIAGVKKYFVYIILGVILWFEILQSGIHATIAGVALGLLTPVQLDDSSSPLDQLLKVLHPWVSFFIMPVFAFCNAGVHIPKDLQLSMIWENPIASGIILGLFVGKPLGVFCFSYLAVQLKLATLPRGVTWRQMIQISFLTGIGFTMALFISGLALSTAELEVYSKLGILIGSILSVFVGLLWLSLSPDIKNKS